MLPMGHVLWSFMNGSVLWTHPLYVYNPFNILMKW